MSYPRQYKMSGGAALVVGLINLIIAIWFIYFLIKCAAHVGAWPFG